MLLKKLTLWAPFSKGVGIVAMTNQAPISFATFTLLTVSRGAWLLLVSPMGERCKRRGCRERRCEAERPSGAKRRGCREASGRVSQWLCH